MLNIKVIFFRHFSNYWISTKEDIEEQRKIVEGADALLNLAGITTYNTRKRSLSTSEEQQRNVRQCTEQPSYRPRLLRKEKNSKVNCKESISTDAYENFAVNEVTNYYNISKTNSHDDGEPAERDKSKFQNSRTAASNGRRTRKKVEKKKTK